LIQNNIPSQIYALGKKLLDTSSDKN